MVHLFHSLFLVFHLGFADPEGKVFQHTFENKKTPKTKAVPLKNDGCKRIFSQKLSIFEGHVNFLEGILI